MEAFVKDFYVQIAVTVSALLTLTVLLVQGFRFYFVPLAQIVREGWYEAKAHREEAFRQRVSESLEDVSLLLANVLFIIIRMFLATVTVIIATVSVILSALAFIPGFREQAVPIVLLDISPKSQAIITSAMLLVSFILFFSSLWSGTKLVFALRNARRNARAES